MQSIDKTEGDINISIERRRWVHENISIYARGILEHDSKLFFHQSMSTPCLNVISKAEGCYIYDIDGRKYLDFHGNSVHQIGHANIEVIGALEKQLHTLTFSPRRYANEIANLLADRLIKEMNSKIKYRVLLTTSGTASIGLALKMARKYTGRYKTISLWGSFHGASLDAISVGGEAVFRQGVGPLLPGCEHIMPYNSYRCMFGDCHECKLKCLDYLEYILTQEGDVAAVLMETIRSTDVQVPPVAYYKKLREICDKHNVLLILDEIPTCLGKTGQMFAFQNYGIEPDILVIGKGLGGGIMPISAVIAREELNVSGDISLGHYTHEKSPMGCVAAFETINYINNNDLLTHVRRLSSVFKASLWGLMSKFESIGDVRVIGLMAAIELVKNRQTKEKDCELAEKLLYHCLENGLSFKISGGNVLTLTPPLIVSEEQLLDAVRIIESGLTRFNKLMK